MSLVMAVICTDGIVVSGDFRRSRYITDPETGENKFEYYDDQHKIFRTSQNRIVGMTGTCNLKSGELVEDVLKELTEPDPEISFTVKDELGLLASIVSGNENSLIEAGIEDGKKTVLIWTPDKGISAGENGGAIGATEDLDNYKEKIDTEVKNITIEEAKILLRKYNEFVALHNPTVSRGCEFLTIT